jgi:4-amino-4-deoxy-L-arabinose transferase-like glycosyltransferase
MTWEGSAFLGVGLLAAVLYVWNVTISGYANAFYSAAALAGSQSWSAWFFGSLDSADLITVDKPPLATMLMGLSVRLFGLSSWSILLPEAVLGVASVLLVFVVVRRSFGTAAATIAGVVMALTPVAVLMFRYDHPDALLTFLMIAGAAAVQRAIENGRHRWLVLAGTFVGLAFLTKYLQAYLVIPGFVLAYALAAVGSLRRRVVGIVIFGLSTLAASAWWVAAVQLTPAGLRPYIGGSTNNSVLDLIFGYDGLGRIFGQGGGAGGGGGGFSGTPGILRLFNSQFGGQISWLLPLAIVSVAAGLILTVRARRTDRGRAAYLLWGGWLAVHALVFSFMSGIVHSYYAVAMAPAVAALVGGGLVALWRLRPRYPFGGIPLAAATAISVVWAAVLLARTPTFVPWLAPVVVVVGLAAAGLLALPINMPRRVAVGAGAVALAAMLAAPAAYSIDTVATAYSGSIVSAGPTVSGADGFGGAAGAGPGGFAGRATPPGQATDGGGQAGDGGSADSALLTYLLENRGSASWLVAVNGSMSAAQIEIQTGAPVMAMGGWSGSDNAPTLAQLEADVASGKLRYVLISGAGGGGPNRGSSEITAWVTANGTAVNVDGSTSNGWTLYDLSAALTSAG